MKQGPGVGGAPLTLYVQQKQEATGLTTSGVGVHRADSTHPGSRSGQNQSLCWDPHYTPEVLRASPGADWGEEEKDAEFHPL